MQKLAGLITESQYKSKINEAEEDPSISDIVKKITQYLKSNDYNSLVFLDGKKIEGNPGDPFEIMGKSNDGNISVVGRGNKPELIKNEMEHLQKWILNNFDSLKLQSPFTPGHMGGDQHNGKFWVKIDSDKKSVNEAEEKTIQTYGPNLVDMLKKNGFDTKFTTNNSEYKKAQEFAKTSDKKLAVVYYNPNIKFISVTTNQNNRDEAFKIITSPAVERLLPDGYKAQEQGGYFIEIQNLS